ncbi:MAG: S1 RNA-binding domain-containing protein, partial [Candidatus Muiribacteriota bacterium]
MNETFTEKQMMEEAVRNIDNISQGNIISGKIVKVTQEDVFVDIGYKSEGKINFSEFEKIKIIPVEGMEIQAKIMRLDDSRGNIVLSYLGALEKQSWEKLLDAHANKKPIIVTIEKEIKGGYSVKFEKTIDMFMPKSQLAGIDGNPEGQAVEVAVIEIDKNKKNIVVSKRELEDSKKRIVWENLFEGKSKGDLIKGRVSRIVDFGAFVDFGGLEGLLHSSDLSWGRVEKVEDFVKTGDEVEVVILDMKKNRFQVSLGLKQKSPEPWKIIQDKYNTGDDVTGKVVSLTKYGAFVALMPGLEGLLHVSDMSWKKIDSPDSILNPGDEVKVRILEIDKENKRISLGIKQLTPDPWEKIDEIAPLDKEVEGKIIKIINSGAILEIINGVEGYIHVSDMSWSRKNSHPQEFVTDGQMVKAKVLEVDKTERKLRLGMKQLTPDPWELAGKNFQTGQTVKGKVTGITKFGAFIEISEGVEGLLHVSDLSWSQKISDVSSVVKEGETIDVMITMLDVENKKLSLGLKQLTEDP